MPIYIEIFLKVTDFKCNIGLDLVDSFINQEAGGEQSLDVGVINSRGIGYEEYFFISERISKRIISADVIHLSIFLVSASRYHPPVTFLFNCWVDLKKRQTFFPNLSWMLYQPKMSLK